MVAARSRSRRAWVERRGRAHRSRGQPRVLDGSPGALRHDPGQGGAEIRPCRPAVDQSDGLRVALVETDEAGQRPFTPWESSPVPPERQVRGLESARMREHDLGPTTAFLTDVLGFSFIAEENGWHRYGVSGGESGAYVDLQANPTARRGALGVGSIHHLAWRVANGGHQLALRDESLARRASQPLSSIDSGFSRCTSSNPEASCSSSPRTGRDLRWTKSPRTSASPWCCLPGWSRSGQRSKRGSLLWDRRSPQKSRCWG